MRPTLHPDPDANARFVLGNIAANGRAFVALVVAIDLMLLHVTGETHHVANASLAVAGLGAAVLADRSSIGLARTILSATASILPAFALLGTFIKVIL